MSDLIEMEIGDGATVWFHAVRVPGDGGLVRAGVGETVQKNFREAVSVLKPLASSFLDQFRGLDHPPDKAEVEFGFGLEAKGKFVIAEGGGQASFKVKLTWNRQTVESLK